MNAAISPDGITGCGSQASACASLAPPSVASVNGIALHQPGEALDPQALRERAITELLRQQGVRLDLLPRCPGLSYTEPDDTTRRVIEAMVDQAVTTPAPTDEECRRHYVAQKNRFIVGQALHVRHILFAVTPGVNGQALSQHAEKALLELCCTGVAEGRFAELAMELSNCPSSAEGGDLGWLTAEACAPELANELFHQTHTLLGLGVHPRLIHSRFGFHILEVLGRRSGQQKSYEEVRERIAARLSLQSRAKALQQYMRLLVGQAQFEGIELEGADSPLVQ